MATEFPQHIHVTHEEAGTADEFFHVASTTTAEAAVTTMEPIRVATYQLVSISEGKLEPVLNNVESA